MVALVEHRETAPQLAETRLAVPAPSTSLARELPSLETTSLIGQLKAVLAGSAALAPDASLPGATRPLDIVAATHRRMDAEVALFAPRQVA